jgi:hypothetical protein
MTTPKRKRKPKKIKFPHINYDALLACLDLKKLFDIHTLELAHYIDMSLTYINVGASSFNIPFEDKVMCLEQDIKGQLNNIINRLHAFNKRRDRGNRLFKEPYRIILAMVDGYDSIQVDVERLPDDDPMRTTQLCISRIETKKGGSCHNAIIPLQFILKDTNIKPKLHMGYVHTVGYAEDVDYWMQWKYAGITGRNWTIRLNEHMSDAGRGSQKVFHKVLSESLEAGHTLFEYRLCTINKTYDEIMAWEEREVDKLVEDPNIQCANMIPGGFKGIKFLHEHRKLNTTRPTSLEREEAIASYVKDNPRAGMPNYAITHLWQNNPEYAEAVICNQPNRLSANTVRQIRELSGSLSVSDICKQLDIASQRKVKSVVDGKTYSRIA